MSVTFLGPKATPLTNGEFEDRGIAGSTSNNGIFESCSDDGGLTWNTPVAVDVPNVYSGTPTSNAPPVNFDVLPQLAIDNFKTLPNGQPNPNFKNQYVVWTRVYGPGLFPNDATSTGGTDIMIAVSKDGGQTWQTQLQTDVEGGVFQGATPITTIRDFVNDIGAGAGSGNGLGLGFVDQPHLTIGPDGDIYVAYYSGGDFAVAHSIDAGAQFTFPDYLTTDTNYLAFGNAFNQAVSEAGFGSGSGNPDLDQFRLFPVREIVADPSRPGTVYAVTTQSVHDANGNMIDPGDVFFARSTDYGVHWTDTFNIGNIINATVVNDDNGGQSATNVNTEVVSGQAQPRLAVDQQGNISLIWYDTRRDPAGIDLDVFGTTSTDGGVSFSPNFRVTDTSFNPNLGAFHNPTDQPGQEVVSYNFSTNQVPDVGGQLNYYLGDFPGLAMAGGKIFAAWTGVTLNPGGTTGNQDIYVASYPVTPAPAPPSDRYEPNNTPATATNVGHVVQRLVPNLALPTGNADWFGFTAEATGTLTVSALSTGGVPFPANVMQLELWDGMGQNLVATGNDVDNAAGQVIGQQLEVPSNAGEAYLVRLSRGNPTNTDPINYALDLQCLTEDLDSLAFANVSGAISASGQALYKLTVPAAGTIQAVLTNGANVQGNLNLQILDPNTLKPLITPLPPTVVAATGPNESIPDATDTGLDSLGSVQLSGFIGNGAFGTTTGDYDFYRLKVGASQRIAITEDPHGSDLDGVILLYDSTGDLLYEQDQNSPGVGEFLGYVTSKADTYYVAIFGSGASMDTPPTDPFTPGTGFHAGSTGGYVLTITVQPAGPGAVQLASVPVTADQTVVLVVSGADVNSVGDFELNVINLDQFTTPDNSNLVFPAGAGPSQVAVGDLNGDGKLDIVVSNAQTNTVSVLINNGDGTFQAPRQYAVGSMKVPSTVAVDYGFDNLRRPLALADLTNNGKLDIVVGNYDSGDVSVLLNRGDGTFEPQLRYNATPNPFGLAVGDLTGNGIPDIVAIDSESAEDVTVAVLLGRGDGTFLPEQTFDVVAFGGYPLSDVTLADLNHDGKLDLIISGSNAFLLEVMLGNGNGTFQQAQTYGAGRLGDSVAVADLANDGKLDIVNTSPDYEGIGFLLGNGNGTFQEAVAPTANLPIFPAGQSPLAVAVGDFGSQVIGSNGVPTLGPPDGHPDIIVADSGLAELSAGAHGPPGIFVIPTLWTSDGKFAGLGVPELYASAEQPQDLTVADLNDDGNTEIVVADEDGVRVIFSQQPRITPNDTPQTARNLGTVVHLEEPTLTIVPGHEDAYYTLTAPTEAAQGAGNEVLDFSGDFQALSGAGIGMEVLDGDGNVVGSGDRFRVVAAQGAKLTLHVFGFTSAGGKRGAGAYTLDIVSLPQVVSIEAQPLLPGAGAAPGGPTASIVVTLQGERLDPTSAQNLANYTVTYLGPDGIPGTADDNVIPTSAISSVVYDPSTNVDVSNGITYPTAVRQTVTLTFNEPLPAGSYAVDLSPAIQTALFNGDEASVLAPAAGFTGHPVVSIKAPPRWTFAGSGNGTRVTEGSETVHTDLVFAAGDLGSFAVWEAGTPFFTQLHDDLGALLDLGLTLGDSSTVSETINAEIVDRFNPALGPPDERPTGVLVLWFDTLQFALTNPRGQGVSNNLAANTVQNTLGNASVNVTGNIETVVLPVNNPAVFQVVLSDVPAGSRAGAVYFGLANVVYALTNQIQNGQRDFSLNVGGIQTPPPSNAPSPLPTTPAADNTQNIPQQQVLTTETNSGTGAPASIPQQSEEAGAETAAAPVAAPSGNPASASVPDHPGPPPDDLVENMISDTMRILFDAIFGDDARSGAVPRDPMNPPDGPMDDLPGEDGWRENVLPHMDLPSVSPAPEEPVPDEGAWVDAEAAAEVFATTAMVEHKRPDYAEGMEFAL